MTHEITPESLEAHADFLDKHYPVGKSAAAAELRTKAAEMVHEARMQVIREYEQPPADRVEYLEKALKQLWDRMQGALRHSTEVDNRNSRHFKASVEEILMGTFIFDVYDERYSAEKKWADMHPGWTSSPEPQDLRGKGLATPSAFLPMAPPPAPKAQAFADPY